jgi:hypothetical protein
MRAPRLFLPAALAALTLGLATSAAPAFADEPAATIYAVASDVVFDSQTTGAVSLDYTCPLDDSGAAALSTLAADVYQDRGDDLREQASGSVSAVCDGDRHSALIALRRTGGDEIFPGAAKLHATLGTADVTQDVVVVRVGTTDPTPTPRLLRPPRRRRRPPRRRTPRPRSRPRRSSLTSA